MITYKGWLCFLIIAKSFTLMAVDGFSFHLDKDSIQVGESAFLTIQIPATEKDTSPTLVDGSLENHRSLKLLERSLRKSPHHWVVTYEITAHEPAQIRIPAIQVRAGADTFSTESKNLLISTSRADNDKDLRPEFGSLKAPFPWRNIYLALIWALSLGIFIWLFSWLVKKIRWKTLLTIKFSVPHFQWESHRGWLRKQLQEIENKINKGDKRPQLVDEINLTLKQFLEKKTTTAILSKTTTELRVQSDQRFLKRQTIETLSEVDSFKYSQTSKDDPQLLAIQLIKNIREIFRL